MKGPVEVLVYFDYICPWCYIAAVRLQQIKEEYGDKVSISWRSYPLLLVENRDRRITPHSTESRSRANLEEETASFKSWDTGQAYPSSSVPALRAGKCAQLQGEGAFLRLHTALFEAFFEESRNISDRQVLISLAEAAGLDVERFSSDFDQGSQEREVLAEYEDGRDKYAGWGIPLVIIGDRYPIMGAVPIAMYRRAIDLCLASQAG
jgi:predicted DsbA family dithiol-disulfide isomerase